MRRAPRGSLGLQGRHLLLNVLEVIKKKDDKLKDLKPTNRPKKESDSSGRKFRSHFQVKNPIS